ncbi:MAG: helix-turn-helix domain-containing protein [Coriobacteriia bacterium]|nr:helix-turn-helix domain-containing protein [Coriobacteriia bacterium]
MAVGDRIKRIRILRDLTQKELGLAVGFEENTADVRIAQYETGTRTPKEDMLKKIAAVLDVNYRAIYEPTLYAAEDVMYTLFELDEHYNLSIHDFDGKKCVAFNKKLLDNFFAEWQVRKREFDDGAISRAEYMEWKLNWPQTADDLGKHEPKKQWLKPPETTD